MTKPRISILSPDFKYIESGKSDIRKLFARVRKERAQEAERQRLADEAEAASKVRTLRTRDGR